MDRESDMTAPLLEWLEARGYVGYCEVPRYCASMDLVGWGKDDALIVIEMKRSLSGQVIHQACLAQTITDDVYCAVASRPRRTGLSECKRLGLGVLWVSERGTVVLLSPGGQGLAYPAIAARIIEQLRRMAPGGLGGVANLSGCGPAQNCERAIIEYREQHPDATWQDVFDNVPNHYAHARSMRSAMRMVRERRAWRRRAATKGAR